MHEDIQAQEETQRYANTEGVGIDYVAEKKAKRVNLRDTMVSVVGRHDYNCLIAETMFALPSTYINTNLCLTQIVPFSPTLLQILGTHDEPSRCRLAWQVLRDCRQPAIKTQHQVQ